MTTQQAESFIRGLVARIGLGFHWESPVSEYIDLETGRPLFDGDDAAKLQAALDDALAVLGESEVYRLAVEATADVRRAIGLPTE